MTQVQAPSFEGFESHVVGAATPSVDAAGFTLSSGSIEIRNAPLLGAFATEGQQFARWDSTGNGNLVFVFDGPVSAFGVTMTDPADNPAAALSLTTNVGDSFPSFLANVPDAETRFFGIINEDTTFDTVTIISNFPDGIGFDEVYFVAVPEPTTLSMVALGLATLALGARHTGARAIPVGSRNFGLRCPPASMSFYQWYTCWPWRRRRPTSGCS